MRQIRAILFDKDGTLFDFQATWGPWAAGMLDRLAGPDARLRAALAEALAFDPDAARFLPHSAVIAGTGREAAELIAPLLPLRPGGIDGLEAELVAAAATAPPVEAVPLAPLMQRLRASGYRLGIATNDAETAARAHLAATIAHYDFIAGYDSGHGSKPAPGMLLAFARHTGLDPAEVLMVGDSRHDLMAGRAAGMATLGVLTGVAGHDELAPLADAVRPDIGHIPALLGLGDQP